MYSSAKSCNRDQGDQLALSLELESDSGDWLVVCTTGLDTIFIDQETYDEHRRDASTSDANPEPLTLIVRCELPTKKKDKEEEGVPRDHSGANWRDAKVLVKEDSPNSHIVSFHLRSTSSCNNVRVHTQWQNREQTNRSDNCLSCKRQWSTFLLLCLA